MIRYALACEAGHRFETWFRDSSAFDAQVGHGLVACPTCRSTVVAKTIMAPAVVSGRAIAAPPVAAELPKLLDERQLAARSLVKAYRDKVLAEGEDVGTRFPEEARRMHDGDIPTKSIYGEASREEAVSLLQDGILVLPLPALPEELN